MIYLFNQYISNKKPIKYALTAIYGINRNNAKKALDNLRLNENKRFGTLKITQIKKISKYITLNYKVGGLLKKHIIENIKKKMKIKSYKGIRHKFGLPVRGQRTHTNAQTQRNIARNLNIQNKIK
jgi:small subunit ribosomal protein S13